jgi:hypothetical protein
MESLVELFCHVDDFCQAFLPKMDMKVVCSGLPTRKRDRSLKMSEIMTILIMFHQSHYRNFKAYYLEHVLAHRRSEFPGLVSYTTFRGFHSIRANPFVCLLQNDLPGRLHGDLLY